MIESVGWSELFNVLWNILNVMMYKHHDKSSSIKKYRFKQFCCYDWDIPLETTFFHKPFKWPTNAVCKEVSHILQNIDVSRCTNINTSLSIRNVRYLTVFAVMTGVSRLKQRYFTKLPNNRECQLLGSLLCYGDTCKYYGVQTS